MTSGRLTKILLGVVLGVATTVAAQTAPPLEIQGHYQGYN